MTRTDPLQGPRRRCPNPSVPTRLNFWILINSSLFGLTGTKACTLITSCDANADAPDVRNEVTGERVLDPHTVPHDVRVSRWEYVGNYGIKLFFSDRHSTGIYTFKRLRNACPCCQSDEQPRTTDAR